eukprot:1189772-Prorocentrum_minimum.AAC.2
MRRGGTEHYHAFTGRWSVEQLSRVSSLGNPAAMRVVEHSADGVGDLSWRARAAGEPGQQRAPAG